MFARCPYCNTLYRVPKEDLQENSRCEARCIRCDGRFVIAENLRAEAVGVVPTQLENYELAPDDDPPVLPFEVPDDLPDIPAAPADEIPGILDQVPPRKSGGRTWKLGVLALTGLLILQLVWIARESLIQYPQARDLLHTVCQYLPCTHPTRRAPQQVVILSRDVGLDPQRVGALRIRLAISNGASFAQPYPQLQVDLLDAAETLVAQRRFRPEEYLPGTVDPTTLMPPNQPTLVRLELVDPGRSATGYRFEFR